MQRTGYDVAEYRDPAAELERLRAQTELMAADEERALDALCFPVAGRALDVGCGPGFIASRIVQRRPELRVVGVDVDPNMVELARARIEAVTAEARRLPFPDETFDAAYARLVLRHVPEPAEVVGAMARVVRRAGRVVVIDGDDDTMLLHPRPERFLAAVAARQECWRRRGGDPLIGRRLVGLLHDAGLHDVRVQPFYVHTGQAGTHAFTDIALGWADAIDPDIMAPADVEVGRAELRAWADGPRAYGMVALVAASGQRV